MAEEEAASKEREIYARSVRDDEFRQALLADPVATLEREYGVGVPSGVTVEVHEETDEVIHLVLPGRGPRPGQVGDDEYEDTVLMGMRSDKTGCCTCGSSTSQSFTSIQRGCGC